MFRTAILIIVGVTIGYFYGFSDAQSHTDNLAVRVVNDIGGKNRASVRTDVDTKMDSVERH
ncbi:MAG TPA: hypothetical protein VEI06_08975 [Gemmatimonadaceae bacterium]|nr:hypothetical protein [Gemmatimonadaceae bacterium]